MKNEIWVLGATGWVVRAVAPRLHAAAVSMMLVGMTAPSQAAEIDERSARWLARLAPRREHLPAGSVA
jgi:hypothetical protein